MSPLKNALVFAWMLTMVSPGQAQDGTAAASQTATGASRSHTAQDVRFVTAASAAGITQTIAARLAQAQGGSGKLKTFAATMAIDHARADDQLKRIAQKGGYIVSAEPTEAQQAGLARLRALRGRDFDAAYSSMMVKDHREVLALFQAESTSGTDGDLKAFATQMLPVLQHHLALANAL